MHSPKLSTCTRSARSLTICRSCSIQRTTPSSRSVGAINRARSSFSSRVSRCRARRAAKASDLRPSRGRIRRSSAGHTAGRARGHGERPKLEEIDDSLYRLPLRDLAPAGWTKKNRGAEIPPRKGCRARPEGFPAPSAKEKALDFGNCARAESGNLLGRLRPIRSSPEKRSAGLRP